MATEIIIGQTLDDKGNVINSVITAFGYIKSLEASGDYIIKMTKDETGLSAYDMSGFEPQTSITIDGREDYSLGWGANSSSSSGDITIQSGVTLTLTGVTLTGNMTTPNLAPLVWIKSGGKLVVGDGAVLTGNQASNGGAVYVSSGGVFEMTGGEITGNKASGYGQGAFVAAGAGMSMSGGSITGNSPKTSGNASNDVSIGSSGTGVGTLTLSGSAQIGSVWLYYSDSSSFSDIAVAGALSGSPAARIDLYDGPSFKDKQILKAA